MLIGLTREFLMQGNDIAHQIHLKLLYIFALTLTNNKFLPRIEEIVQRNDTIVAMDKLNLDHPGTPPPRLLPLLQKAKSAYILWHEYHATLPKTHRYSLGQTIDKLFIEKIEAIAAAAFLSRTDKIPFVRLAIRKLDTIKLFVLILWETKSLDNKKYIALSIKIDEIGKMLGGWNGQLQKQNSPTVVGEK